MMTRGRRQRNGISRACFGLLLILALMLRAAIPDGFMPSTGKGGMARMMICTGMAGAQHKGGDDGNKNRGSSHSSPCAFTLLLAYDVPGLALAIPGSVFDGAVVFSTADFLADPAPVKPWLSRGPPQFLA